MIVDPISRRSVLLTSAAVITAASTETHALGANQMPEPIESMKGGTDIGPRDAVRDAENPDILTPPSTDKGLVPNLRFSLPTRT
jgi:oxalate decarboxylase